MAIIQMPADFSDNQELLCVVCCQPVPLHEATAGSIMSDNQQAFAHESHRVNRAEWLFCWLEFEARQRQAVGPLSRALL